MAQAPTSGAEACRYLSLFLQNVYGDLWKQLILVFSQNSRGRAETSLVLASSDPRFRGSLEGSSVVILVAGVRLLVLTGKAGKYFYNLPHR